MKKHTNIATSRKGVTLIELSVVIAVILVLLSVLFIGAAYYRNSANRSACVINQSAISKAAESYMNIQNVTTVTMANLTNATATATAPVGPFNTGLPNCPETGSYSFTSTPANGQLVKTTADPDGVACSIATHVN